jgi:hypothetical protein
MILFVTSQPEYSYKIVFSSIMFVGWKNEVIIIIQAHNQEK